MSAKNLVDVIELLDSMDYTRKENLAYLAVGILYGLTILEETYKETPDSGKKETEETK